MVLVYCAAMGSEPQQCILFSAKSVRGIRFFITQRFDDEWVFITQILQSVPRSYAEEWVFIAQIMQSVPQSFDEEWVFITQISGSMPQSRAEEWMCIAQSCAGGLTDLAKGVFEVGNVGC